MVVIMRGLPGSGKSTRAKEIAAGDVNTVICSADDYFVNDDGVYCFDAAKIAQAHAACMDKAESAVRAGRRVIIDNTNVRRWEAATYARLAAWYGVDYVIEEVKTDLSPEELAARNVHGVPTVAIELMVKYWQNFTADDDLSGDLPPWMM